MNALNSAMGRIKAAEDCNCDYVLVRWISKMAAVEVHSIWERYVENRLVAALNHSAQHFLSENDIKGVTRVSSGLAYYVIRGGGRFFDFRSMADLLGKADRWLGRPNNPFRVLLPNDCSYIDALAAIRNRVVHGSSASIAAYKRELKTVYGIRSAPDADEFLSAKDTRASSPARYNTRLYGLVTVVIRAIQQT